MREVHTVRLYSFDWVAFLVNTTDSRSPAIAARVQLGMMLDHRGTLNQFIARLDGRNLDDSSLHPESELC